MENPNERTLLAYAQSVQKYIDRTEQDVERNESLHKWIDKALEDLPRTAHILEIGSGFGRDASAMEAEGYSVERTDATQGFVDYMVDHGSKARLLNALKDDLGGPYDLIFANAVLLHFRREEFALFLSKAAKSLTKGGKLAFTLKQGEGEGWSTAKLDAPRFYCYWMPKKIEPFLRKAGFKKYEISTDEAACAQGALWLDVVARV